MTLTFLDLDLADQWLGSLQTVSLQRHSDSHLHFVIKVSWKLVI